MIVICPQQTSSSRTRQPPTMCKGTFPCQVDQKRFVKLLAELDNNYARKQHQYPTTIKGAYDYYLLLMYTDPIPVKKTPSKKFETRSTSSATGPNIPALMDVTQQDDMTFLQDNDADLVPNTDGKVYLGITCGKCSSCGHYGDSFGANKCLQAAKIGNQVQLFQSADSGPSTNELEQHLSQFSFFQCNQDSLFAQQSLSTHISNTWILLDSCSTVSVFNNPIFLSNIRTSTDPSPSKLTVDCTTAQCWETWPVSAWCGTIPVHLPTSFHLRKSGRSPGGWSWTVM